MMTQQEQVYALAETVLRQRDKIQMFESKIEADNKYLCRRNGYSYLQPTLKAIKQGLFEVDLRTRTVRITPKGLFKLARDMEDDRQGWLFTEEEDF